LHAVRYIGRLVLGLVFGVLVFGVLVFGGLRLPAICGFVGIVHKRDGIAHVQAERLRRFGMERHFTWTIGQLAFHQQGNVDILPQRLHLHRVIGVVAVKRLERLALGFDLGHALDLLELRQVIVGKAIRERYLVMVELPRVEHALGALLQGGPRPADAQEHANAERGEHENAEE